MIHHIKRANAASYFLVFDCVGDQPDGRAFVIVRH